MFNSMSRNSKLGTTAAAAALLLMSTVVSACSGGGSGGNASSASPATSAAAGQSESPKPAKKDPVTLEISWWGGDTRHAAIQEAIKLFQQKYDWITVKPSFSGFDGYLDKLTVQLSTGKAPDVFMYSRAKTQEFGKSGVLLNYYDYKADLPFLAELDKYMQSPYYKSGDKLIGLASGITSTVVVYNKKVYDDAKVPYPTDTESWKSLGEKWTKVHQANAKVYGDDGWFYMPEVYPLMMKQLGAELVDGAAMPPTANMHPDKAKTIWAWNEQLWADKAVPRDSSDTIGFEAGNLATALSASSVIPSTANKTKDPLGFSVLPMTFDGSGRKVAMPPVPAGLWGVPAKAKHPQEALLLISFLMTDPGAVKALGVETGVPAVVESLELLGREVFKEGSVEHAMLDVVKRSQQGADEYWLPAQPLGAAAAADAFKTSLEKYIFKKANVDQFLTEAGEAMNKALRDANK